MGVLFYASVIVFAVSFSVFLIAMVLEKRKKRNGTQEKAWDEYKQRMDEIDRQRRAEFAKQDAERKAQREAEQERASTQLQNKANEKAVDIEPSVPAQAPAPSVKRERLPNLLTKEQISDVIKKLDENTATTAFRLNVNYDRTAHLCGTKLGGVPYWREGLEYPVDADGKPLVMLAQIRLDGLETGGALPQSGLLQFFIEVNFSKRGDNVAHKVVYHSNVDESVTVDYVRSLNIPMVSDCEKIDGFPVNRELAIDSEKTVAHLGRCDFRLSDMFCKAAEEIGVVLPENAPENTTVYEEAYRCMPDTFDERMDMNRGSWLLGYPHFTQDDVRYEKGRERYDTLLLQLDSEYNRKTREYDVLWGDAGVGNFFINSEDLGNLDFSNTLFSWDCY